MFQSRIDTSARHIIISVKNEDSTGVQHLPAPAAGEAAGCVGHSPGGGEQDRNPRKSDERDRRHR